MNELEPENSNANTDTPRASGGAGDTDPALPAPPAASSEPSAEGAPLKLLGPNGAPVSSAPSTPTPPKRLERDTPELTRARSELWEAIKAIELEIGEARTALLATPKAQRGNVSKFIARLDAALEDLRRIHALAYVNTLEERYDAIQPICVAAIRAAQVAGIPVTVQR